MAKKSDRKKEAERGKQAGPLPASEPDKVPFQVRFDRDLHEQLAKLSELTAISLNQLVQGICRGVIGRVQVGSWEWQKYDEEHSYLTTRVEKGCVWFGQKGEADHDGIQRLGDFWFGIDVRERGDVHHA